MNRKLTVLLTGILILASAAAAQAQSEREINPERLIDLQPTLIGAEVFDAAGLVKLEVKNRIQIFAVTVTARAEDGTLFIVKARRLDGREFDVGVVSMLMGVGTLVLQSGSDPSFVFPLQSLAGVTVHHSTGMILTGEVPQTTR